MAHPSQTRPGTQTVAKYRSCDPVMRHAPALPTSHLAAPLSLDRGTGSGRKSAIDLYMCPVVGGHLGGLPARGWYGCR
eukprot:scaffold952_cov409-Prasinococcus_capsulatus_cf.AAC.67